MAACGAKRGCVLKLAGGAAEAQVEELAARLKEGGPGLGGGHGRAAAGGAP